MRFSYINLLQAVILFLGLQSISLSQTIETGIKDLSKGADVILTGKVIGQQSQWNGDRSMILTKVTIKVDEYLKGSNAGGQIVVTHPGGEVGETGEYYSHIPRFENNESVLVFLQKQDSDMNYRVYEGESGKYSLIEDNTTGEKVTARHEKLSELKKEIRLALQKQ